MLDGATIVGFGQATWNPDEGGPLHLFVRVHPDHQGAGLGTSFVSWAEALADERGAEGIRSETVDVDQAAHDLLRGRGYRQVRSFFTMWKELAPDEDPGTTPDGVRIREYRDTDERVLYDVHEASFADHWEFRPDTFEIFNEALHGEDWDPSLVFLAEADGKVVGHVVSYLFENQGFVAILGVVKPWRGRGIATAPPAAGVRRDREPGHARGSSGGRRPEPPRRRGALRGRRHDGAPPIRPVRPRHRGSRRALSLF